MAEPKASEVATIKADQQPFNTPQEITIVIPSLLSFAALLLAAAPSGAADAPRPNFVVILIDDKY